MKQASSLPAVSVIICVYTEERWHDICDAIASLRAQTLPPREIILAVDHNPQLYQRILSELPDVLAVENNGVRGLSGARNSGLAVASGSLIAFLDDDATADPDWLERLAHCCEEPRVLGAGGSVEPAWLTTRPGWFPEEFYWVVGCSYQRRPAQPVEVRNPYGGCTCIKREVFEAIGGFRSGIGRVGNRPYGGEETELSIRARQYWPQRVFLYEPLARIHHRIQPQRTCWSYFCARCYAEGLSKAVIARCVGANAGLAAERTYTLQDLPRGVIRNCLQGLQQRNLQALLRAGAIIAGLAITVTGYLVGRCSNRVTPQLDTDHPIVPISTIGIG